MKFIKVSLISLKLLLIEDKIANKMLNLIYWFSIIIILLPSVYEVKNCQKTGLK